MPKKEIDVIPLYEEEERMKLTRLSPKKQQTEREEVEPQNYYPVERKEANRFKKFLVRLGIIIGTAFMTLTGVSIYKHHEKQVEAINDVDKMLEDANLEKERSFKHLNQNNMGPNLKMYIDALYEKYPNLDEIISKDDSIAHFPYFNDDLYGLYVAYVSDKAGIELSEDTIDIGTFNDTFEVKKLPYADGDVLEKNGKEIFTYKDQRGMALTNAYEGLENGKKTEKLGIGRNLGGLMFEFLSRDGIVGTKDVEISLEDIDKRIEEGNFRDSIKADSSQDDREALYENIIAKNKETSTDGKSTDGR